MNLRRRRFRPVCVLGLCLALLLTGCGGGAVAVRSNFAGAGALPAAAAPSGQGLTAHYSGSGNLGLAILAGLIIADVVHWSAVKLKQAFRDDAAIDQPSVNSGPIIELPKKCVYPVPEMC